MLPFRPDLRRFLSADSDEVTVRVFSTSDGFQMWLFRSLILSLEVRLRHRLQREVDLRKLLGRQTTDKSLPELKKDIEEAIQFLVDLVNTTDDGILRQHRVVEHNMVEVFERSGCKEPELLYGFELFMTKMFGSP